MKPLKHKNSLIIFALILLISNISIIMIANAQDEDILTLTISRNFGTAYDNKMEGDLTVTGSGPEKIVSLTLYFNGTEVCKELNNQISFRFDTKDYPLGLMNITLIGEDSEGMVYKKTIFKEFISPKVGIWTLIIVGAIFFLSIVIIVLILVSRSKKKENEKESAAEKKNKIKIDIDKDFL